MEKKMGIWLCRDVMKFGWDYTENFPSAFDQKCEEWWAGNSNQLLARCPFERKLILFYPLHLWLASHCLARSIRLYTRAPLPIAIDYGVLNWPKSIRKIQKQRRHKCIKNYYRSFLFFSFKPNTRTFIISIHFWVCVLYFTSTKQFPFTNFSHISLLLSLILSSQPTKAVFTTQPWQNRSIVLPSFP